MSEKASLNVPNKNEQPLQQFSETQNISNDKIIHQFKKVSHLQGNPTEIQNETQIHHENDNKNIFIYDWDDTLFIASYWEKIQTHKVQVTAETRKFWNKCDHLSCKILAESLKKGSVYIVTNAQEGWVQQSSKEFMPLTHSLLITGQITIISARTQMIKQPTVNKQFLTWKEYVFNQIFIKEESLLKKQLQMYKLMQDNKSNTKNQSSPTLAQTHLESSQNNSNHVNVICVGDSSNEIQSMKHIQKIYSQKGQNGHVLNLIVKTVKMKECPEPQDLIEQLQLLKGKIEFILKYKKKMTIRLERRPSQPIDSN